MREGELVPGTSRPIIQEKITGEGATSRRQHKLRPVAHSKRASLNSRAIPGLANIRPWCT